MILFASVSGTNLTGRTYKSPHGTLMFQQQLISGSSGTVYIAEYTENRMVVAVKVIPRSIQPGVRSTEEFNVQRLVQGHENIARVIAIYPNVQLNSYNFHSAFTGDFLVFDLYLGGDLFTAITSHRYGAQDDEIRKTFLQVLSAVEHCHAHGVFHRDIKPENILCSEDGRHVFLADFGLATKEDMVHCRSGSPMYMSWECSTHHTGDAFSAKISDVWSLGMVLLALVTGHCAWTSVSHADYDRYRTNPDLFWKERFPISKDLRDLLNEVFVQEAKERITLEGLRERVEHMQSFYLTEEELANALPTAKAVWYACVEGGHIKGGPTFKPLGSHSNDVHPMPPSARGPLHRAMNVLRFISPHKDEQGRP